MFIALEADDAECFSLNRSSSFFAVAVAAGCGGGLFVGFSPENKNGGDNGCCWKLSWCRRLLFSDTFVFMLFTISFVDKYPTDAWRQSKGGEGGR